MSSKRCPAYYQIIVNFILRILAPNDVFDPGHKVAIHWGASRKQDHFLNSVMALKLFRCLKPLVYNTSGMAKIAKRIKYEGGESCWIFIQVININILTIFQS